MSSSLLPVLVQNFACLDPETNVSKSPGLCLDPEQIGLDYFTLQNSVQASFYHNILSKALKKSKYKQG